MFNRFRVRKFPDGRAPRHHARFVSQIRFGPVVEQLFVADLRAGVILALIKIIRHPPLRTRCKIARRKLRHKISERPQRIRLFAGTC